MGSRSWQAAGWLTLVGSVLGLAYLLDPAKGRGRRARLQDHAVHTAHQLRLMAGKTARDLAQRAEGVEARGAAAIEEGLVPDDILVARLRSKMGRIVSHPHAIRISATDGRVVLEGTILKAEAEPLLHLVRSERGVEDLEDRLAVHEWAADVPALQGGWPRQGLRLDLFQENWSPATRFLAGLTGIAVLATGARARPAVRAAAGVAGTTLLARASFNLPLRRLFGIGAGRRAVDITKTLNLVAPVEEVFAYWANPENYPRFLHHVRSVRSLGEGRYHWLIEGPAGIPIAWEAEITDLVPDDRLVWESLPGTWIGNSGQIRFLRNADGTTRMDVRMSYNPPLGALCDALAHVLGVDPEHMLDEDLMRFKSLVELGKADVHGREVTSADLSPIIREIQEGMERIP